MLVHGYLLLIPLLLLIAGLIAASEASLLSLTRSQLESLKQFHPVPYLKITKLLQRPEILLSTIVVAIESINIVLSTLVTSYIENKHHDLAAHQVVFISIAICSTLLLFVSEILPKITAFKLNEILAPLLVHLIQIVYVLVRPVQKLLMSISLFFIRLMGFKLENQNKINEQDILGLIELGAESGTINKDETKMIQNVFAFSDKNITSLMTAWEKVNFIYDDIDSGAFLEYLRRHPYSRIPVVNKSTNRVAGILYSKEFLNRLLSKNPTVTQPILSDLHAPYIITTHKPVAKLFREFKTKKVHMALVVDEFGNQLGLVTLEDILNGILTTS